MAVHLPGQSDFTKAKGKEVVNASADGQTWVYAFTKGDGSNKQLLGGKGANLCEMTQIGLNVPPGFVVTTQACLDFLENDELPEGLTEEVNAQLTALEEKTGKGFGDPNNPNAIWIRFVRLIPAIAITLFWLFSLQTSKCFIVFIRSRR